MIRLHRIYFFFWKLIMRSKGIKIGTFFVEYSEQKHKDIKGVVTSLSGDSITKNKFGFDININWLEPLEGYDSRCYTFGSYRYKDTVKKLRKLN